MSTELPRREGDGIRIPDLITGPNGEVGEGSRVIVQTDAEWRRWNDYLIASGYDDPTTTAERA
jgi:hypothetical protein